MGLFTDNICWTLGIFRASSIANVDESDEKALEARGKVVELLGGLGGGGGRRAAGGGLGDLTQDESRELASGQTVGEALQDRRSQAQIRQHRGRPDRGSLGAGRES